MGKFIKGDIVVVPFPFSDLSSSKRRPALVLADIKGDDIILCQITSQPSSDPNSILLSDTDFTNNGKFLTKSYIRIARIFTADKNIIVRKVGSLKQGYFDSVIYRLIEVLKM